MTSASIFPATIFSNVRREIGRLFCRLPSPSTTVHLATLAAAPGKGPDVLVNLRLAPEAEGLSECQVRPSSG